MSLLTNKNIFYLLSLDIYGVFVIFFERDKLFQSLSQKDKDLSFTDYITQC